MGQNYTKLWNVNGKSFMNDPRKWINWSKYNWSIDLKKLEIYYYFFIVLKEVLHFKY